MIGKQLDLFSIQEVVGPGLVFWHPRGAKVKWLLTRAVEDDNVANGYELVYTPNITREELFIISGHLPYFEANQYPPMAAGAGESKTCGTREAAELSDGTLLYFKSQHELPRSAAPSIGSGERLPEREVGRAARAVARAWAVDG